MKVNTLKKELHQAIDTIQDQSLLEAVYTILNKSINDYILTREQKKELNHRLKLHNNGESKSIPMKNSLRSIREKLRK